MTDRSLDHTSAQADLGVLVLGALEPGEREALEAHVAQCPTCAATLAEFAPLPGLLKRVDTASINLAAPPAGILERALAQVRLESAGSPAQARTTEPVASKGPHRVRSWRVALAGLAVAAAVAIAAIFFIGSPASKPHISRPAATVVAETDSITAVWARVVLRPTTKGTSLALAIRGVGRGAHCSLVAVGRDGKRQVTSTWVASYSGSASINTATSMRVNNIRLLEITTLDGRTLIQLPVHA